jgi:hypothetical protein
MVAGVAAAGNEKRARKAVEGPKPFASLKVNNDKGLAIYDVFGNRRSVPVDPVGGPSR